MSSHASRAASPLFLRVSWFISGVPPPPGGSHQSGKVLIDKWLRIHWWSLPWKGKVETPPERTNRFPRTLHPLAHKVRGMLPRKQYQKFKNHPTKGHVSTPHLVRLVMPSISQICNVHIQKNPQNLENLLSAAGWAILDHQLEQRCFLLKRQFRMEILKSAYPAQFWPSFWRTTLFSPLPSLVLESFCAGKNYTILNSFDVCISLWGPNRSVTFSHFDNSSPSQSRKHQKLQDFF